MPARAPRRLSRQARHEQLVDGALPVVAAEGLTDFSLDAVAAHADVTRNLLYHYFPRGRPDIVLAALERSGQLLTGDWVIDADLPLADRLDANNARMIEHAMKPSDAWRVYRHARGSNDPEIRAVVDRFVDAVVASMAVNHLGRPDPPPVVRVALVGYLAFFEAALDAARTGGVPAERLHAVLAEALTGALRAAGA